jgi:hypothetical protein
MFNKTIKLSNGKIKEDLDKYVKNKLYIIQKGDFNKNLDENEVKKMVSLIIDKSEELKYSIGTGKEDINTGIEQIKKCIEDFLICSKEHLMSGFKDSFNELIAKFNVIIDLEKGVISDIVGDEKEFNKKQKNFNSKINELDKISLSLVENKNGIETKISKFEREMEELKHKIVNESNMRIKQSFFDDFKALKNEVSKFTVYSDAYSSSIKLIKSIKNFSTKKDINSLTERELAEINSRLEIDKIKEVVNQPEMLRSLLSYMEDKFKETKEKNGKRNPDSKEIDEPDYAELEEFEKQLLDQGNIIKEAVETNEEFKKFKKNQEN